MLEADIPLNLAQLARHAGVSRSRVWEWLRVGCKVIGTGQRLRLPAQRQGGRWVVSLSDFESWKTQLAGEAPPAASARLRAYAADLAAWQEARGKVS